MKLQSVIPVVFSTDENYVPFMSVAIQSVMECASVENCYRIYVLHDNITNQSIESIKTQVAAFSQFSIEFINGNEQLKNAGLITKERFGLATYFRLLIPYIFTQYEKMIYFDCDIICQTDIAELYETALGDSLFAAVKDMTVLYCHHNPQMRHKFNCNQDAIKLLKNPDNYFNAGILVLNNEAFRHFISLEKLLETASSRTWYYADQDILNILCEGKVKYLHPAWNLHSSMPPTTLYRQELDEAQKNPKIIHLILKPWNMKTPLFPTEMFFGYAQKTPFINSIIGTMYKNNLLVHTSLLEKYIYKNIHNTLGLRFIVKCLIIWIKSTVKLK